MRSRRSIIAWLARGCAVHDEPRMQHSGALIVSHVKLGPVEGVLPELFLLEGQYVDDVIMALDLTSRN